MLDNGTNLYYLVGVIKHKKVRVDQSFVAYKKFFEMGDLERIVQIIELFKLQPISLAPDHIFRRKGGLETEGPQKLRYYYHNNYKNTHPHSGAINFDLF